VQLNGSHCGSDALVAGKDIEYDIDSRREQRISRGLAHGGSREGPHKIK